MGRIGYFQRSDTVALGDGHAGKLKRWRSGRSSKTENRRSKLSLDDISKPKDYKHIFHVGVDGKVEGDPTFGGDYRNIPKSADESSISSDRSDSKESTPTKSPAKPKKKNNNNKKNSISAPVIELSKETILPPPNGFDSGSTISVPDVVPTATTHLESGPPKQFDSVPLPRPPHKAPSLLPPAPKAPIASLAEPEVAYTNGSSSSNTFSSSSFSSRDNYTSKDAAPSASDDSFDMGSLMDDMMSIWDTAKLNLDTLEPTPEEEDEDLMADEEDSLLEGEENELCNGDDASLSTINRVSGDGLVASSPEARANGSGDGMVGVTRGGLSGSDELAEQGAVGGACAAGSSASGKGAERGLLTGNIIIKDSMTKPTKSYRKVPRQTPPDSEEEGNGTVTKPESQPQEPPPAPRTRPGREVNLSRQMSREKRWDSEFKRLSSSPKDRSADNDYIDTNTMEKKDNQASEEYEELALASSPQPYTLRDSVLDSANVMRGPRLCDASRTISMRTTRPSPEGFETRTDIELARSRSLREAPVSPLGQQAYNSLVGGDISSNARRTVTDVQDRRRPPAVPPKPPSRVRPSERNAGDARVRNGDARLSASSQRSTSTASSDDCTSEDIQGNIGAVASLRKRFNASQSEDAPPRPPRESPETLSQRQAEQAKASAHNGVRLRRRDQTASNGMNENFYASEPPHENNNSSTDEAQLSPTTLQNLEQHMPRRMRRSIGGDRIKRRSSSDISDSETDSNRGQTERGWSMTSRASEGDSSSEEMLSSNRLSSSSNASNERGSFPENPNGGSGYKTPPPRPLYDLPEDQTNSNRIRPALKPPLPPTQQLQQQELARPLSPDNGHLDNGSQDNNSDMDERPPPLPPRVEAKAMAAACSPLNGTTEGGYAADFSNNFESVVPPPRPQRRDTYTREQRSQTFDVAPGEPEMDSLTCSSNQSNYDYVPPRRPISTPFKSHSIDVVDFSDDYMVGSAASIRQLLKETKYRRHSDQYLPPGRDQIDCDIDDADNLDDMPETPPPPVPTNRNSFVDSTYGEITFTQRTELNLVPPQWHSGQEVDYVMMRPQTQDDVKREYIYSEESDYAVPRSTPYRSEASPPRQKPAHEIPSHGSSLSPMVTDKRNYQLMHPANQQRLRTRSDLPSRPAYLSSAKPLEQRRGTVSASSLGMGSRNSGELSGTSSLPRRDQGGKGGADGGGLGNANGHRMRRSRSSDDILREYDWTVPQEAESLQDLLARAYVSPSDHPSHQNSKSEYLIPPSARRRLPPPPPPPPSAEKHLFASKPSPVRTAQYSPTPSTPSVIAPPSSSPSSSSSTPPPNPKLHTHTLLTPSPTAPREAEYLDMSQASLERKKKQKQPQQEQEKASVNWTQPVPQGMDIMKNRLEPVTQGNDINQQQQQQQQKSGMNSTKPVSQANDTRKNQFKLVSQTNDIRKNGFEPVSRGYHVMDKSGVKRSELVPQGDDIVDLSMPAPSSSSSSSHTSSSLSAEKPVDRPVSSGSARTSPTPNRMRQDPLADPIFVTKYTFDPNDEEVDL